MMSSFITIIVVTSLAVISPSVYGEDSISFSIVEELPSGYRVGSIANESEAFLSYNESRLLYNFLPPTEAQTLFSINDETGDFFTSVVIDREGVCEYDTVCSIIFDVAVRSEDNQFFQLVPVIVYIEDENDNAPLFPVDVYHLNISEGSHTGAFSIPQAIDKDTGGNNSIQSYQLIVNEESEGYFKLNYTISLDKTFVLKLILTKILDRETRDTYNVEVIAKDGGNPPNTGNLKIVVNVLDTNDNAPEFTQKSYNVSVKENIQPMETILTLSADDKDLGVNALVTYRISEFQKDKDILDEIFVVDSQTGELKVKTDLSTVAGLHYRFIVEAVDHGTEPLFSQAEVIVHIEDYTNNAPSVSVSYISPGNQGFVNISENARNASFVAHVNVDDQDSGLNGVVDCEISDKHFGIVPLERGFKVTVNAVLDREVKNSYNLTITCYDKGTPVMSGSTHFIVRITDYNDNKPVFDAPIYTASIPENNKGNEILVKVSANDADEGNNAIVHYVPHNDADGRFIVDRNTGVVNVNSVFDRELEPTVTFHVLAIDNGSPSLTGTATVVLNLVDRNDNVPTFKKSVHGFQFKENQPTGTDVSILEAFDIDDGANAEFDFAIESDYLDKVPFVLFSDGLLKANKQLDREERSRYDFVAVVTDHGQPKLSSMAHVTIIVEDMNDNSPIISYPSPSNNTLFINYPDKHMDFVAQIEAYDLDEGINKELKYSIKGGNDLEIFDIDVNTGVIYIAKQVDIGGDHVVQLGIAVTDKGSVPLETVTFLNIELKYTNGTFLAATAGTSKHIIISVVVVLVTLVISGAIIGVILVLRTLDRKQKMKNTTNNSANSTESDFGFPATQNHTVLSSDTLSSGSTGEGNDLIKKKEVSFVLDNNDSFDYHQKRPNGNTSTTTVDKPSKSSLRYSPQVTKETPQNVLDTRELQNEANAQLQSMKIQQMILQTRAKQWVQQQQQQYGIIPQDGDHHSDGSAETIGSDSGRGCSEEDDVFSTPSADDPKLFELSSPESQHSFLPRNNQTEAYTKPHNQGSYAKQPWSRRPHLAQKDFKTMHSQLSLHRNLNVRNMNHLDNVSSSYGDSIQNRMSWGSSYYGSVAPMDYTGDSALHSFFDKTPVMLMPRDDDDNCSTTTSGSYTLQSEDIL